MSGMTTALLLANEGVDVVLIEAHSEPGGCAGFFRRGLFSFDVGATTFISFQEGGIGHRLVSTLKLSEPPLRRIEHYQLCLPDRRLDIPQSWDRWPEAWATCFPEIGKDRFKFFHRLSLVAQDYWSIACRFPSLPLTGFNDLKYSLAAIPIRTIPNLRWFLATFDTFLRSFKIDCDNSALNGAFRMLLQDTTQADISSVPASYAFLGLTLMPHGLYRPVGGARALWKYLLNGFLEKGGRFFRSHEVGGIKLSQKKFQISFKGRNESLECDRVISSIPVWNTHEIAPELFNGRLKPYLHLKESVESAFALYVGVKDFFDNTNCQHFQVIRDPLGNLNDANNLLISISDREDLGYAPTGCRSVTISTHTDPKKWFSLSEEEQTEKGQSLVNSFLAAAETLFPGFGQNIISPHVYPASPATFKRFTRRHMGMAGNYPLNLMNSNLNSIPRRYGTNNFLQIGETTFPGAGTVATMLSGFNAFRDFSETVN